MRGEPFETVASTDGIATLVRDAALRIAAASGTAGAGSSEPDGVAAIPTFQPAVMSREKVEPPGPAENLVAPDRDLSGRVPLNAAEGEIGGPASSHVRDRRPIDVGTEEPPSTATKSGVDPYGPVKQLARTTLKVALVAIGGYFALVVLLILAYRFINPPTSTLIAWQWLTGVPIAREWKDIEDISPELVRAVVIAEDWSFCRHHGIDFEAIEQAIEKSGGGLPRGASTISMQVVKNLFLNQSRSYVRKAIELPLTLLADAAWPKRRMLEIYLNIAEWGPGVFGAEAAARHHFGKSAADLTPREAALLASVLPNPIDRSAGNPGRLTAKKASVIQARVRAAGNAASCALPARPRPANAGNWETTIQGSRP